MASALQIKTLRIEIRDPYGIIDIAYVADPSALPAVPAPQTAYLSASDGAYYRTDKSAGAVPADYQRLELQLSDSRLEHFIDLYGEDRAVGVALRAILRGLGAQFPLIRQTAGAESVEYQSLSDLYNFYKSMIAEADDQANIDTNNNAGRYARTRNPSIGGGNL